MNDEVTTASEVLSTVVAKIKDFLLSRDTRQKLETQVKYWKGVEDAQEADLWADMERLGVTSIKTEEYGLVTRTQRHNPYVIDFQKFKEWCIDNSMTHLIREDIKRQMLRDYISARISDGAPDAIPAGIDYQVDRNISVRGRPKE